jgi:hypothetical protein
MDFSETETNGITTRSAAGDFPFKLCLDHHDARLNGMATAVYPCAAPHRHHFHLTKHFDFKYLSRRPLCAATPFATVRFGV